MARDFTGLLSWTPYQRRDPVTGRVKTHLRKPTARQTSPRLKAFQNCVADEMRGRTFNDSRAVRQAFGEAARQCSAQVPARVEA